MRPNQDYSEYAAMILAGGESSRMGRDKTRLELQGKTMVERLISVISPIVSTCVVMLNESQDIPELAPDLKRKVIFGRDSIPRRGPLGAISDGVNLLPDTTQYVYMLASDLPYITTDWMLELKNAMTESVDVAHAVNEDISNPLIALYRKTVLLKANDLLLNNRKSPFYLYQEVNTASVFAPESDPHILNDMNHPEDFEAAKLKLS